MHGVLVTRGDNAQKETGDGILGRGCETSDERIDQGTSREKEWSSAEGSTMQMPITGEKGKQTRHGWRGINEKAMEKEKKTKRTRTVAMRGMDQCSVDITGGFLPEIRTGLRPEPGLSRNNTGVPRPTDESEAGYERFPDSRDMQSLASSGKRMAKPSSSVARNPWRHTTNSINMGGVCKCVRASEEKRNGIMARPASSC